MAVYNLGSFGPQRPSAMEGLDSAIARGLEIGVQKRQVKAQETQNKYAQNLGERKQELEEKKYTLDKAKSESSSKLNKARTALADAQVDEEKRKGSEAFVKKLAALQAKDPDQFNLLVNNEGTKLALKEAEKYIPLSKDKAGNYDLRGIATEDFKQSLGEAKAHIAEKLLRNEELTPREQELKSFLAGVKDENMAAIAFNGALYSGARVGTPQFTQVYLAALKNLTVDSKVQQKPNVNPALPPQLQALAAQGATITQED